MSKVNSNRLDKVEKLLGLTDSHTADDDNGGRDPVASRAALHALLATCRPLDVAEIAELDGRLVDTGFKCVLSPEAWTQVAVILARPPVSLNLNTPVKSA